jgi:hypothetical protein
MPEPVFKKLGIYIMASEPISMAYFHQCVCLYVCPLIVARQRLTKISSLVAKERLGKNINAATTTQATM